MDKLLLHEDTFDAKLISSDKREFFVHKAVVALASHVLKLHFFTENKSTSVHQMQCPSKPLAHMIDFMCKGQDGLPISWFDRFLDWHEGTTQQAVEEWVDIVVTMCTNAKKLQMHQLQRALLMNNYKFLMTSPDDSPLVVPALHERCFGTPHAEELLLLAHSFYKISKTTHNQESDKLLSHGKKGKAMFPEFDDNNGFGTTGIDKNFILVTCAQNPMNGFYYQTEQRFMNETSKTVITHVHEDGTYFFEEEWNAQPDEEVPGTGTLYTTKQQQIEHRKCHRQSFHLCSWDSTVEHPIWITQTPPGITQHPVIFRFSSM